MRNRSTLSLAAVPLILLTLVVSSAQPAAAQCDGLPGCVLVWSDEFDGNEVDLTKWTFQLGDGTEVGLPGGWGNGELQFYQAENATVDGGFLTITAREEPAGGLDYTSARMRSLGKGDWTFGRFEMRARMPIGQGFWPAFWMLSSDPSIYGTWAASGEMDIVEYIGSEPDRIFGTIHYGAPFPGNVFSGTDYFLENGTFNDDFHVFAMEWELGEIRWYVDGELYATRNDWFSTGGPYPAPFDVDFHLLLNLAVGGNLPGPPDETSAFPQEFVVDYVRVYQVPNDPPQVTITSPTTGATIDAGSDLVVTVEVTDDGTVQSVELFQDAASLGEDLEAPFEITIPGVAAGCYTLIARAKDDGGLTGVSDSVEIMAGTGCPQAPYLMTPVTLPGTVEAENYDLGGQSVAYNDTDASNNGGAYRPTESVDIEGTTDSGFGFNVGWIAPGEWLEYTVDVTEAGIYDIDVRVASQDTGGELFIASDGVDLTGPITFDPTGGFQSWTTVRAEDVMLEAGVQTLRMEMVSGEFNVNKFTVAEPGPGGPGGEDVAVFDDFEDGDISDWLFFGGNNAGGGGGPADDRPQEGDFYFSTGWGGQGSASGFYGGMFKNLDNGAQLALPRDPWFNVSVLNQSNASVDQYTLEITIREDLDGNGWTNGEEDSFRLDTVFPSAAFNDQWTLISAPLSSFTNLFTGGDGTFDGNLDEMVIVVAGVEGADGSTVELDFDYFAFTPGAPTESVIDDFEDGDISDWLFFGGNNAGGGGGPAGDRPQEGNFYFSTGWGGQGSASGFYGGMFKNFDNAAQVALPAEPWFNVWVLNQSDASVDQYTLEITLREDLDGNGWTSGEEDSFRLDTAFPASSFDDQWTLLSAPVSSFINLFTGGDGTFDGNLDEVVIVIAGVEGADGSTVEVDFDYFIFTDGGPLVPPPLAVFDDFEDGDASDWFFFGGNNAGGGGGPAGDLPAEGGYYFSTGWGGQGSASGFYGGFFKNLDNANQLLMPLEPWFNVWVLNQSNATVDQYTLEITIREDLDGNGWTNGQEDSFRLDTVFPASSFDDRWTLLSAPVSSFTNLFTGGDGTFDGNLDEVVGVISGVQGTDGSTVEVDFDYFAFTAGGPFVPPPPPTELGLRDGRFQIEVEWQTADDSGTGKAVELTEESGYFWFFDSDNAEVLVKVLDACNLEPFRNFWVFSAGLTNVAYQLTVTDTQTGQVYTVANPQGFVGQPVLSTDSIFRECGDGDGDGLPASQRVETDLLPPASAPEIRMTQDPGQVGACVAGDGAICLTGGRFRVAATWHDFTGGSGAARMVRLSRDSGYSTFFDDSNAELFMKVLDACGLDPFNRFWPFVTGLTNLAVELTITDTWSGKVLEIETVEGQVFPTVLGTGSFFDDCSLEAP